MKQKTTFIAAVIAALSAPAGIAMAQETITLRFTQPWPDNHPQWKFGGQVFVDHVSRATNGQVEFELYHAAQLGNDSLALLSSGLTDIALMSTGYAPDRMPLSNVTELPGFFVGACDANRMFRHIAMPGGALYENEYKDLGLQPIYVAMSPAASIVLGNASVDSLDDLRGLKLRASGGGFTEVAAGMGAVPVQTVASELYDALSRGTIDGALYYYVGMPSFSLEDVFKSGVDNLHLGASSVLTVMTDDRWAEMPPNVQEAMAEGAKLAEESLCQWFDENETGLRDQMVAEGGFQLTSLPEADLQEWDGIATQIAENWAKRLDDNGRKGSEVLEAYREAE